MKGDNHLKRLIYVAHKFGGLRQNKEAITHICQRLTHFGVIPISPVHAFSYLHDSVPGEREKALEYCMELLPLCHELWLFGEWEGSEGCVMERELALQLFKPIRVIDGWRDGEPVFRMAPQWWHK